MFADASAMVSILTLEDDYAELSGKLAGAARVLTSAISVYEAVLAVTRRLACPQADAEEALAQFIAETNAVVVPIDSAVGELALRAFERFGKGRHRASLNMGDCFSYACAKAHNVPLLFKGDDFIHTDIAAA